MTGIDEDNVRELLARLTPHPPAELDTERLISSATHAPDSPAASPGRHTTRNVGLNRWVVTVAAAVLIGLISTLVATLRGADGHRAVVLGNPTSITEVPPRSPAVHTDNTASRIVGNQCGAQQLDARATLNGGEASAPFVVVELRNAGHGSCLLSGYPRLALFTAGSTTPLPVAIAHGTYERPDPGPTSVLLNPGATGGFVLGTSTAYQGGRHLTAITRLAVDLAGHGPVLSLTIPHGIAASRKTGQPFPIGITAFALVRGR